jgi:hypothetical protein
MMRAIPTLRGVSLSSPDICTPLFYIDKTLCLHLFSLCTSCILFFSVAHNPFKTAVEGYFHKLLINLSAFYWIALLLSRYVQTPLIKWKAYWHSLYLRYYFLEPFYNMCPQASSGSKKRGFMYRKEELLRDEGTNSDTEIDEKGYEGNAKQQTYSSK